MQSSVENRRKMPRFDMQLPLEVESGGNSGSTMGITKDISAGGVYFFVSSEVVSGDTVEFVMTFPPEITLVKSLRVRCTSRVLRVEPENDKRIGVAAQIQRYEFIATAEA